jgi:hypothetical protein
MEMKSSGWIFHEPMNPFGWLMCWFWFIIYCHHGCCQNEPRQKASVLTYAGFDLILSSDYDQRSARKIFWWGYVPPHTPTLPSSDYDHAVVVRSEIQFQLTELHTLFKVLVLAKKRLVGANSRTRREWTPPRSEIFFLYPCLLQPWFTYSFFETFLIPGRFQGRY